jgi:hypothetical protein
MERPMGAGLAAGSGSPVRASSVEALHRFVRRAPDWLHDEFNAGALAAG